MKKLTLILLLAIAKIGLAQQDTTLIYNSPMYTKDPVRSKWRPVVKQNGEFYQVTFYDKKDIIQEIINFEDKDLTVRQGPYTSYRKGKLWENGNYDKGHKNGEWKNYNILTEQVTGIRTFLYGKLNGKSTEYWSNQQIKEEGTYENGSKVGDWKLYYSDGKSAGKETYDVYGKKSQTEYFYKDGQPAKYEDLFSPPSYKGGIKEFYQYLAETIKYPKESAKDGIQGTVFLRFTVKKDGSIEDIEVMKTPNDELADEAIRIVQRSSNWIPGKDFGETVNVKYNIPIKFSLGSRGF